jgi:acyl-coenzyme A thioesterase PaaI-like protein
LSAGPNETAARLTAPVPHPEPGWEPVVPFPSPEGTFLHEGDRVRIAYFRKPNEPQLYAKAWFGTKTLGPPGHVHGGAMAAALDEAMGAVCWMNHHRVVAATITVRFIAMLKLESETIMEAVIERVEGRKISIRSTLTDLDGRPVAEGQGLFVILKDDTLRAITR